MSGLTLKLDMGNFCRVARPSEESTDNTMSLALLLERSDLMKTAWPGVISGGEISSDLYRASQCDIKKLYVESLVPEKNQ